MMKLWAAFTKDLRILLRDKVGITLMFVMPVLLVVIVTAIQNNTFNLLSSNQVALLLCNQDTGNTSKEFVRAIGNAGMFDIEHVTVKNGQDFSDYLHKQNASVGVFIPNDFSGLIQTRAAVITSKALNAFGLQGDSVISKDTSSDALVLYYDPEIQPSYKLAIQGALSGALQMLESRQALRNLYYSINEKTLPVSLEKDMLQSDLRIAEQPLSLNGSAKEIPNAAQHNVPAWTIFAMFFIILSLGGSVVREKTSGSFIRLKTMPTNFYIALLSKQITFLLVTLLQAAIIFAIGMYIFPLIHLPALRLPEELFALLLVTLLCGWCAVSYAICVGLFARTQEQVNGFGAISIVIFAIIGGLMVPAFAMPPALKTVMGISPLHWCLEAYYALFLKGGKLKDVLINIVPIFAMIIALQLLIIYGLKRKKLL